MFSLFRKYLLLIFITTCYANIAWSTPPTFNLTENVAPEAWVTQSYGHYAGGLGITPWYGYYTVEIPSMNDNGVIVGRVPETYASTTLIKNSGEAAKWVNGTLSQLGIKGCKDEDQDGLADNSSCGSRALAINNSGLIGGASKTGHQPRIPILKKHICLS